MDHMQPPSTDDGSVGQRCVCFNLRRAARAVSRFYDRQLAPSGLRSTQFSMLMTARAHGPLTISRLAEHIVAERTTLTRNLAVLERQGLLRIADGEDRRERYVRITPQGEAALEAALPLWRQAQAAMEQSLGPEQLQSLLGTLTRLSQGDEH